MILRLKVAAQESRQLSSAKDVLGGAGTLFGKGMAAVKVLVDSSIWWAIAVFVVGAALAGLMTIGFYALSNEATGIPFLGALTKIMFWLSGLVLIMVIVFGKWVIIFRG